MKRLICLIFLLLFTGCNGAPGETKGMVSEVDRQWYLQQMGRDTTETPLSIQEVRLPEKFPAVLEEYNKLQLQQGFDLTKYRGKAVTVYTYELRGNKNGQLLFVSLYQYKNRIIGGDVHSAALNGYMGPILPTENG